MPSYASRTLRILTTFLVALALAAGTLSIAVLMARNAEAKAAPVSLEPAAAPGASPFVPSLTASADPATADGAPADTPADAATESAGTGDQFTCDPQQLADYLGAHSAAATAWVDALNSDPTLSWSGGDRITVEQIPAYIGELTPAVLGDDMRVTNYRFTGDSAGSVQSVLQKNTAVLMDARGVPRVRCACGNPLTPATAIAGDVEYQGEPWTDLAPVDITVADAGTGTDADAGDRPDGAGDPDVHPSCGRHQQWDGDRCTDVRHCPPGLQLGDDGRCHRDTAACPPGLRHDRHGVCRPDGTLPPCSDGTAARADRPCGPPPCPPVPTTVRPVTLGCSHPPVDPSAPAAQLPPADPPPADTPPTDTPAAGVAPVGAPPAAGVPPDGVSPAVGAPPAGVSTVGTAPAGDPPGAVPQPATTPVDVLPGPVSPSDPVGGGSAGPPSTESGPAPVPDPVPVPAPDPKPVRLPVRAPIDPGAVDCTAAVTVDTCPPAA